MSPLLERLRAAGLVITLVGNGDMLLTKPKSKVTPELHKLIIDHKLELVEALRQPARQVRRFELSRADADRCHLGGWSDHEISSFTARVSLFMRRAVSATDADDLAERLTLRDREHDDRVLCLECAFGTSARCPAGHPLPLGVLQRCSSFGP